MPGWATVANLALLVGAGSVVYLLVLLWPQRLVRDGVDLVKKTGFKRQRLPLADLAQVNFHYDAVVGFSCVWEFVAFNGDTLSLDSWRINRRLVRRLQDWLPNFYADDFHHAFAAGDVVDSLAVWRAVPAPLQMEISVCHHVDAGETDADGATDYCYEYQVFQFRDGHLALFARSYDDTPDKAHLLNFERDGQVLLISQADLRRPLLLAAVEHLRGLGKQQIDVLGRHGYEPLH
ncbi:MAG: hypothetical protein AAGC84_12710 [Pseudomonas sp.]